MADHPAASPSSAAESSTLAKLTASKDRECPYCHISFTSSSLGRHLDLYIKEKNPKPQDGVHNVDEIRKSRGSITRRQAKKSGRRDSSTPSHANKNGYGAGRNGVPESPSNAGRFTDQSHATAPMFMLNRHDWTSTGVITDAKDPPGQIRFDQETEPTRLKRAEIAQKRKLQDERERGQAAELALREVLDSIKAAAAHAHSPTLFDFDFYAQSFPTLVLHMLSAPPTIHSTTPLPHADSWPVNAPGKTHYELLERKLEERLKKWHKAKRRKRSADRDGSRSEASSNGEEELGANNVRGAAFRKHLAEAYDAWLHLPDAAKGSTWQLEILRAFACEQQSLTKTKEEVEQLKIDLERTRMDIKTLYDCQMPREFLTYHPTQLGHSGELCQRVVDNIGYDSCDLTTLIEKWRARVRASKNAQRSLPEGGPILGTMPLNTPAQSQSNGETATADPIGQLVDIADEDVEMDELDEDEDAAGEDEEIEHVETAAPPPNGVLDPSLREGRNEDEHQPRPHQPVRQPRDAFTQQMMADVTRFAGHTNGRSG